MIPLQAGSGGATLYRIAAGAVEIESRELVRRLRAAGLRLSPAARRAMR